VDVNADFMQRMYMAAHEPWVYQKHYAGKRIVIVFDNSPAHSQIEQCMQQQLEDLQLQQSFGNLIFLCLGPYSFMLSPIKGCFASLKAALKFKLVHYRGNLFNFNASGQVRAHCMHMLEVIFEECMHDDILNLLFVQTQEMHCQQFF